MTGTAGELTESQAARLLARMKALYGAEEYDPAVDVTAERTAAQLGVSIDRARDILAAEAKAGRLVVRSVVTEGKRRNVYRAAGCEEGVKDAPGLGT